MDDDLKKDLHDSGFAGVAMNLERLEVENESLKRERAMLVDLLEGHDSESNDWCREVNAALSATEPQATQWLNDKLSAATEELRRKLAEQQAMFHVNMLRAWPEKSHDEIQAAIKNKGASDELDSMLSAAKQEGYEQGKQAGRDEVLRDGYVIVPIKPTEEMLRACQIAQMEHSPFDEWMEEEAPDAIREYRAMISASPSAPEKGENSHG